MIIRMSRPSDEPQPVNADHHDASGLLEAATRGESNAAQRLFSLIYDQLHALARKHMLAERPDHTLQATALVHEAYLRLVKLDEISWQSKAHFYVAAANAMRRILVDHARIAGAVKRGVNWTGVSLHLNELASSQRMGELLAIDEAMEQLNAHDAMAAQVVQLRFFGGLSIDEAARTLGLSPRTVDREWKYARTWLRAHLAEQDPIP